VLGFLGVLVCFYFWFLCGVFDGVCGFLLGLFLFEGIGGVWARVCWFCGGWGVVFFCWVRSSSFSKQR